jgi:hypothetical membrane protein
MKAIQIKILWISILSVAGFLVLSSLAMYYYPGGTIHDRGTTGYTFWHNYFSDLGRTRSWSGARNTVSNQLFRSSLFLASGSLIAFFILLPSLFKETTPRMWALLSALLGIAAALCYIGIAMNPLDVDYRAHTVFVRAGFIAFLLMSFSYARAIRTAPAYPDHYAFVLILFSLVLFVQVAIMLFGPRSWSSPQALFLQASAQKVVVYAEMGCMLYQSIGALRYVSR